MKLAFIHGPMREEVHMLPRDVPFVVVECRKDAAYGAEQLRRLSECDAFYVTAAPVTAQVLEACPGLKMIQTSGTGYDGIDIAAATARGILCCNNADTNSGRSADFAMLSTLSLIRNYIPTVTAMKGGLDWEAARHEGIAALETEGKTLGILGFGDIGHKLALRAQGFGMRIIYCDINAHAHRATAQKLGAKRVGLDTLCSRADVISVHVPLDEHTHHMLGAREFALMKDGVFIVCTARGGIVDELALRRALDSGKVAGAAIDVFSMEPISPDNPLVGAPCVCLTPHVASRGREGVVRSFHLGIANIRDFIQRGRTPANILNPEARPGLPKKAGPRKKAMKKAARPAPMIARMAAKQKAMRR